MLVPHVSPNLLDVFLTRIEQTRFDDDFPFEFVGFLTGPDTVLLLVVDDDHILICDVLPDILGGSDRCAQRQEGNEE